MGGWVKFWAGIGVLAVWAPGIKMAQVEAACTVRATESIPAAASVSWAAEDVFPDLLEAWPALSADGPIDLNAAVSEHPRLSTARLLLRRAGIDDILENDGPYTIIAPTDEAFDAARDGRRGRRGAYATMAPLVALGRLEAGVSALETLGGGRLSWADLEEVEIEDEIVTDNGLLYVVDVASLAPVQPRQ